MRSRVMIMTLGLLVALGVASVGQGGGQRELRRTATAARDYDVRANRSESRSLSAAQRAALRKLGRYTVAFELRTGVPRSVNRFGGYLSRPSRLSAATVARGYLATHADLFRLSRSDLDNLAVSGEYVTKHNGVTQLTFRQLDEGRTVFGSALTFAVDRQGRILTMGGDYFPGLSASGKPALSAAAAVTRSAGYLRAVSTGPLLQLAASTGPGRKTVFANSFAEDVVQPAPVTAELVTFPVSAREARLAWRTELEVSPVGRYESVVDAQTGRLLHRLNRVRDSGPEGTVFTSQNPVGSPSIVPFTGWVGASLRTTSGNNTNTYIDQNGSDAVGYQPQTPDTPDPAFQHFNYTFANAYFTSNCADITTDRNFTVTQLFYWVNFMHDYLYGLGFNENSRNFQSSNFGLGGSGGDPVLAEGYDNYDNGSVNNANFSTGGGDGSTARLQVFLGAPPFPCLESEIEGDTVLHEYTHGLSTRLVGGGNLGGGTQSGGMGEGWSDFMAASIFNDPVLFEYDSGNATTGLRRVAYNNSPWKYTNLCNAGCEVHNDGEIWATVLWDLRTEFLSRSYTAHQVEQLVVDGMKNTIANPTFLDARNGIIAADVADYGGVNACHIWGVFAARELGFSAASPGQNPPVTAGTDGPGSCTPVASSGGPYTTNEGTNAALNAAGTAENGDGPFAYSWDLNNDGVFGDATGKTPSFTSVGQDGVYAIKVKVTNGDGFSSTASTMVTVNNVVPTVTTLTTDSPKAENSLVSATVVVRDPGWLDAPTATIDWGDGTGTLALSGTLVNGAPPAAILSAAPSHTYGDNGTFTLTICPSDEATGPCSTTPITVTNIGPTASIDKSGATLVNGTATFLAHAGEAVPFSGRSTDPGSDDLTLRWHWDDGSADSVLFSLNDPIVGADPFPSPTINPRDVTDAESHTFGSACFYTVGFKAGDDDGGVSPTDTVAVIITGNATTPVGAGYWQTQYRPRPTAFPEAKRKCYLAIAGFMSAVFNEVTDASTVAKAFDVLFVGGNGGSATQQLDRQLLTTWLNFANGAFNLGTLVDTNGDGVPDTAFSAVIAAAEAVRLNPASTPAQLRAQKNILERING